MDLQLPPVQTQPTQIFWPIFGEKYPSNVKKFWTKGKSEIPANVDILFESELLRIGKKKVKLKSYHIKMSSQFELYYFKKKGDKVPKGSIKLTDQVQMKLQQFQVEKDTRRLGVRLYRTDKITYTLLSDQPSTIFQIWEVLAQICVMNNFEDMYQPMNVLGKGSFATVYKVKKNVDDQFFAAKIYYKDTLQTNQHKDKFVNMVKSEAFILRKLDHENIAKVHEVFQQPDKVVLVMDFVGGPDLYQLIKRKKQISEKNAAIIMCQLAQALIELTKNEYVHRDLKLENILLQSYDSYKIKIVDFGFSEKINYGQLLSKAGTPGYIPPELFFNKPYTSKGDIFSLGVILFSLVGGHSPFKGKNYKEIMEQNKHAHIAFSKSIWLQISEDCKKLIMQMCDQNPELRPSAEEILKHKWITQFFEEHQKFEMSMYIIPSMKDNFDEFQLNIANNGVPSFYQRSNFTIKSVHQVKDELQQDELNEEIDLFGDFENFLKDEADTKLEDSKVEKLHQNGLLSMAAKRK